MTGFLKYCNCKFSKICNYSLVSLCNVEECRCQIKNYLFIKKSIFYLFPCSKVRSRIYDMYAVNNVTIHVKFVEDT